MTRYKDIAVFFALILAVAGPLILAGTSLHNRSAYKIVQFNIEPYDPRDLLYGHYLRFRIDWNSNKDAPVGKSCMGKSCCLCIGEGDINPPVYTMRCKEVKKEESCLHQLKGRAYMGARSEPDFDIGINRYYVDETQARPLETLFALKTHRFTIGLSLTPKGKAHMEELYIDGMPLNDYLASQGGKILPDSVE